MRSEKSAESHVVCLVDDDPLVLNSLGNLLASDGIAARCFDKAETFLAHIQVHRVELVVLDIRMVGMTGLEVQAISRRGARRTRPLFRAYLIGKCRGFHRKRGLFLRPCNVGPRSNTQIDCGVLFFVLDAPQ